MPNKQSVFLVAVGSNQQFGTGDVAETVASAINRLASEACVIRSTSRFFETPCFPKGAGPDFVNAALRITASWTPQEALEVLHSIEAEFDRTREVRWAQRTLDLDLLAVDQMVLPDAKTFKFWHDLELEEQVKKAPDTLILPHPRLHERAFVLVPLADVAAEWRHPVLNLTVSQLLERLPESDLEGVKPLVFQGNRA